MIIVPHPDDEVLGFGGAIQGHIEQGDRVFVYYINANNSKREIQQYKDLQSVSKYLKFQSIVKNIKLNDTNFKKCINYIENEIEKIKPDILYTVFYGDNHQDHEYIFKAVKIATRIWSSFLVKKIYLGEILSSTDQAPKNLLHTFCPTHYVALREDQVIRKSKSISMYKDEVMQWPHPRSEKGIINLAERRGSECKSLYAEAFVILRDIKELA